VSSDEQAVFVETAGRGLRNTRADGCEQTSRSSGAGDGKLAQLIALVLRTAISALW